MNILVAGACGQLGREMREVAPLSGNRYFFADRKDEEGVERLDICDAGAVKEMVARHGINVLLNFVAYTDVEGAESDEAAAFKVNAEAPGMLAEICRETGVFLIHISTDFVFDGRSSLPYLETDEPSPLSVYGKTKLEGDRRILASGCDCLIFRTSWLYSRFGNNFIKKIRTLCGSHDSIKVVIDEIGNPTNAADLAGFIFDILEDGSFRRHRDFTIIPTKEYAPVMTLPVLSGISTVWIAPSGLAAAASFLLRPCALPVPHWTNRR